MSKKIELSQIFEVGVLSIHEGWRGRAVTVATLFPIAPGGPDTQSIGSSSPIELYYRGRPCPLILGQRVRLTVQPAS